jgi:hypothetical protein
LDEKKIVREKVMKREKEIDTAQIYRYMANTNTNIINEIKTGKK